MQGHIEIILKRREKVPNFISHAQFEGLLSHAKNSYFYLCFVLVELHLKPAIHCMSFPGLGERTSFHSRHDNPWRQRTMSRKPSNIESYQLPIWKEQGNLFFKDSPEMWHLLSSCSNSPPLSKVKFTACFWVLTSWQGGREYKWLALGAPWTVGERFKPQV